MRTKQNTLLAGVAALALVAGTGLALAQQSPQNGATGVKEQSGMPAQTAKPNAAAGSEQHAQTGTKGAKTGGTAALNTKGEQAKQPSMAKAKMGAKKMQQMGENKAAQTRPERLGANAKTGRNRSTARNEHERRGHISTAERKERGRINTAQRNEHNGNLKGLQGNAAIPMQGSHVSLTPEQRSRVRDTVIDARGAPKVGHVNFNVRVGTLVPRSRVHVIPVPETLVQIDPGWRGFLYFIVRDEVVIVNPRDMRIVAVLPA